MRRQFARVAFVTACTVAISSCASVNFNAIPSPGASFADGYDIGMEFESVLNLPEGTKVMLDGVTVGVVSDMTLDPDFVKVTARLGRDVAVPSNIQAVLEPGDAQQVVLDLRGAQIVYDAAAQTLSCRDKQAPLPAVDGCVQLEILVDRLSIEIFGNGGRIYMPMGMVLDVDNTSLGITAQGGTATIRSLTVHEMQSAWRR